MKVYHTKASLLYRIYGYASLCFASLCSAPTIFRQTEKPKEKNRHSNPNNNCLTTKTTGKCLKQQPSNARGEQTGKDEKYY